MLPILKGLHQVASNYVEVQLVGKVSPDQIHLLGWCCGDYCTVVMVWTPRDHHVLRGESAMAVKMFESIGDVGEWGAMSEASTVLVTLLA